MAIHRRGFVREPEVKDAAELKALLGDDGLGGEPNVVGSGSGELGSLEAADGFARGSGSIEDDILWVYNNLSRSASPGDAPSPGAWSLLCDLQKDGKLRASFWTSIIPKFLKNVGDGGEDDEVVDGTVQVRLIDRIRAEREKALE